MQHLLEVGGTNYHYKQVKTPGTSPIEWPGVVLSSKLYTCMHEDEDEDDIFCMNL